MFNSLSTPAGNILNSVASSTIEISNSIVKSFNGIGEVLEAEGQKAKQSVEAGVKENRSQSAVARAKNFDVVMKIAAQYNFTPANAHAVLADIVADL